MIKTKNIYQLAEAEDGYRLLVMRRWPRGIKKERVNGWEPELGPSLDLLGLWRRGEITWPEFKQRYEMEIAAKPQLAELRQEAYKGLVTLLCSCRDEEHCHRSLLKTLASQPDIPGYD